VVTAGTEFGIELDVDELVLDELELVEVVLELEEELGTTMELLEPELTDKLDVALEIELDDVLVLELALAVVPFCILTLASVPPPLHAVSNNIHGTAESNAILNRQSRCMTSSIPL